MLDPTMTVSKPRRTHGGVLPLATRGAGRSSLFVFALALCGSGCPGDDQPPSMDTETTTTTGEDSTDGPMESSSDTAVVDTTSSSVCGDGVVEGSEACDDMGESATCNADCTAAVCGDGIVNMTAGEQCDDMGASGTCTDDCMGSACGDGIVNMGAGEECDDRGESADCDVDCTASACGDGLHNPSAGEECDDGNSDSTDLCDTSCVVAPEVVLDGVHVLDTDTGELDGEPLERWDDDDWTWSASRFELTATGILTVVGTNPLTLDVATDVIIAGQIDLSGGDGGGPTGMGCSIAGEGGVGGPGGFAGGAGGGEGGSGNEDGEPGGSPGMDPAGGGICQPVPEG